MYAENTNKLMKVGDYIEFTHFFLYEWLKIQLI